MCYASNDASGNSWVPFLKIINSFIKSKKFKSKNVFLQSQNVIDLNDLIMSIAALIWTFAYIFMCCELGDRVSAGFDESYETICQVEWYAYPTNIQRMLHMIMINVQKPVVLRSFGNIPCVREQVKKVRLIGIYYFECLKPKNHYFQVFQGGFSFFMTLRRFRIWIYFHKNIRFMHSYSV